MSEAHSSSTSANQSQETSAEQAEARNPLEKRDKRREKRGKNTLIWRELALIAALCIVILAFNLNWGSPEGDQDMAARQHNEIRLRDVRVTPPEPEPPEPEPKPERQPEPVPEVPDEMPRQEVPDEQVQDEPETTDEPVTEPIRKLETAPQQQASDPAPQTSSEPVSQPKPPTNKVFSKNTADRNAQMRGGRLAPEYPERAKRAGIEGQVILQFVVDESGRPQDIQVLRSPNDLLADAAVDALEDKSFKPARQNGQAVKMRLTQPVTFRLQ